jgi:ribosome biogenesis GTPase
VSRTFPALVVSVGKNAAWIVLDDETTTRIADLKRSPGKREMPVPGDRAQVRLLEDGRAKIEKIEPRSFVLERRTAAGRSKIMAANVDTVATVTSLAEPPPRIVMLDQLLAFAELENAGAVVIFTKPDLAPAQVTYDLTGVYERLGYPTIVVNAKAGVNVERLRELLRERETLLCGASGVGKSSIFRALGGQSVIGELSRHGIGRQTTSSARLYRTKGGFLIDSPGVAEFGLGATPAVELVQGFREMAPLGRECRFTDCRHLQEPGCAVRSAVAEGRIAASRYESYTRILSPIP